ncbi:MAG: ATP-binding protein [Actinobacteria bacterium]|nr:ATP-binding protein [Actinomycetota bacterium]
MIEILTSLLDNALKYSPEGGRVELGARAQQRLVQLWVRDEGIGIEPGKIDRIFERFYQVDQTATRRFGVGLGLYLVRELVASLGGTVEVRSEPGRGRIFTISLPIDDREVGGRTAGLHPQATTAGP